MSVVALAANKMSLLAISRDAIKFGLWLVRFSCLLRLELMNEPVNKTDRLSWEGKYYCVRTLCCVNWGLWDGEGNTHARAHTHPPTHMHAHAHSCADAHDTRAHRRTLRRMCAHTYQMHMDIHVPTRARARTHRYTSTTTHTWHTHTQTHTHQHSCADAHSDACAHARAYRSTYTCARAQIPHTHIHIHTARVGAHHICIFLRSVCFLVRPILSTPGLLPTKFLCLLYLIKSYVTLRWITKLSSLTPYPQEK